MRKLNHGATILVLLLLATVAPAQSGKPIRIDENSDWWSVIRENDSDEDLKPQDLDIDASISEFSASRLALTTSKLFRRNSGPHTL